jgi:hypothetical protein
MTRANPAITPSYRAQLGADLERLQRCSTLSQVRDLGKQYGVAVRQKISFSDAQKIVREALKSQRDLVLNNSDGQVEDEPQGSTAAASSPASSHNNPIFVDDGEGSPLPAHRLSYSAVLSPAAPKGGSKLSVIGSVIKPKPPLTKAVCALQDASPLVGEAAGVTQPAGGSGQPDLESLISAAVEQRLASLQPCPEQASYIRALEQRLTSLEQERASVESLSAAIESLRADLTGLRSEVGRLREQQHQCQATALSATQSTVSLQGAVDRLQDQAAHADKLHQEVGLLRSQQQRLAEQQELEECQRAVVLKAPADQEMPACEPVAVESWLKVRLGQQPQGKAFTVLRVHQLRRQSQGGAPGKTTTYKVVLGDSGQRDSVLRSKAAALRGSAYTIDVCLTRQQLVSKRELMSVAKSAAQHGQRVRWKYNRLYIDGKEYQGSGSQPRPRQQQQEAGQPARPAHTTTPPALASPPELEEGEWQVASTRKQQRRQRQRRQQRQARDSAAGADSQPPSPTASPRAARNDGQASGNSTAAAPRPAPPASKPAGKPSTGSQRVGSGAAAKGPSKKPQRSYAAAAAKGAAQGKENSGSGSSSSGAKGAGRAPLAPLALPTNSEGAQHSGGSSQHGQQPQQPSSNPTSPPRA